MRKKFFLKKFLYSLKKIKNIEIFPLNRIIPGKLSQIYPYFVCLFLWFFVLHLLFLIFTDKHQTHLYWGNITIFLQDYKLYYLLPKLLYTLQTAITATLFLINEREVYFQKIKLMFINMSKTLCSDYCLVNLMRQIFRKADIIKKKFEILTQNIAKLLTDPGFVFYLNDFILE